MDSLIRIVASSLEGGDDAKRRIMDQVRSFRHENRFYPEALAKLDETVTTLSLQEFDKCDPAKTLSPPLGPMSD